MSVDIKFLGFFWLSVVLMFPISLKRKNTYWEYCTFLFSFPTGKGDWYFGWEWNSSEVCLMFGPWTWEKML
ncbi:hypothetical protein LCGC14_0142890 [marine sediment metagenome]|uniref:Uncharacterized protein n=1 Tax=marine sediment metagenome TaxID=412755 RepID=A0A0F9V4X1_9ZZZZ